MVIDLDHLAHWVPDLDAAHRELARVGFNLTPDSEQHAPVADGGPAIPAGAANRCIMLERGYLEILTATADTPTGRELRAGMDRYVGVHLLAFGSADAAAQHARLERQGFPQRPLVRLRREVEAEDGSRATLRFTVARAAAGVMREGRVQFVTHHTREHLWQSRYLRHPNRAIGLDEAYLVVDDLPEALDRFGRYLGRRPVPEAGTSGAAGGRIATDAGDLVLLDPAGLNDLLPGVEIPTLPFIAGYRLRVRDLERTAAVLDAAGLAPRPLSGGGLALTLSPACGATLVFAG